MVVFVATGRIHQCQGQSRSGSVCYQQTCAHVSPGFAACALVEHILSLLVRGNKFRSLLKYPVISRANTHTHTHTYTHTHTHTQLGIGRYAVHLASMFVRAEAGGHPLHPKKSTIIGVSFCDISETYHLLHQIILSCKCVFYNDVTQTYQID